MLDVLEDKYHEIKQGWQFTLLDMEVRSVVSNVAKLSSQTEIDSAMEQLAVNLSRLYSLR